MKIQVYLYRIVFCSLIFSIVFFQSACNTNDSSDEKITYAIMQTELGEVVMRLYDDTPLHKENFIKNVKSGVYDGVSFHRIIRDFMVQTGDPATKEQPIETDSEEATIEAEIREAYVHTEGKVGAARKPDDINPDWRSSSTQFFIVTGKPVTYTELEATNLSLNNSKRAALYRAFQEQEAISDFDEFLEANNYEDKLYYDQTKIREYARKGGAPHLDFQYTIFGEVLLGMDIIRQIEQIPTTGSQPLQMVRIKQMEVFSEEEYQNRNKGS